MNTIALLKKLAESRPKLADQVEHWALPKEKLFPIDTPDLVKTAARAFDNECQHMSPSQRLVAARGICARADELDVLGIESSLAYKYASSGLSPHFHDFVELRREATAHTVDEELDQLVKVAHVFSVKADINDRIKGLDKIASALEDFDRRHDLDGQWGLWFPDPGYSTYGLTLDPGQEVQFVVKVADYNVTQHDFDTVDWSRVDGKLEDEVIEGLRSAHDKLAVFASLPAPEKEIIFQSLFTG